MSEVIGGYQRPTATSAISCSHQCHLDRPTPSTEAGTDYAAAYGSSVVSPEDGVIHSVQTGPANATGRFVAIDLADGTRVRSLHLSRVLVSPGQRVKRGQEVAKSGASGFGKDWGYGAHVHETWWDRQGSNSYLGRDTKDFEKRVGADNDGGVFDQDTANRQNWLNVYRGAGLVVDGIQGPATTAAIKAYQTFLGVTADGAWGPLTQAAHQVKYDEWARAQAPAQPQYHNATVADIASLPNTRGLQKIARLYGYSGALDNQFGAGSQAGLQKFLNQNYGGSLPAWLRAKWGYSGNDQWGPVMAAAATRADTANWAAL